MRSPHIPELTVAKIALLLIDIQNDYFPEGKFPLAGIEAAAAQAARLLAIARDKGLAVVHVRHEAPEADAGFFGNGTEGARIHPRVAPREGETVIVKQKVNSFLNTDLDDVLKREGVSDLVIVGAMSHMCVDAATRAALDLGYGATVVQDATATRDLSFAGAAVPAAQVQTTMLAALAFAGADIVPATQVASDWSA